MAEALGLGVAVTTGSTGAEVGGPELEGRPPAEEVREEADTGKDEAGGVTTDGRILPPPADRSQRTDPDRLVYTFCPRAGTLTVLERADGPQQVVLLAAAGVALGRSEGEEGTHGHGSEDALHGLF